MNAPSVSGIHGRSAWMGLALLWALLPQRVAAGQQDDAPQVVPDQVEMVDAVGQADADSVIPVRACAQPADDDEEIIDLARRQVEQTVCGAVLWFDGLFGEQRNLKAARNAYGRLETSLEYSEFYGFKWRTRFNVRVDLPNLEERVSVFVGRDNEDNVARDRTESHGLRREFPQIDDRDRFFAGIGYALPGRDRMHADVRAGVRNLTRPRAFVQLRMGYLPFVNEDELVQLRLTPFYNTRDGLGLTLGADYSRVLTPRLLFRWDTAGTLTEETHGLDWRSAFILYEGLGWERGLAYEAFVRGVTETDVIVREFGVRLAYRQPILDRRLYVQPLMGYSWPREDPTQPRDGAYLLGIEFEMPFGGADPRRYAPAARPLASGESLIERD